MAQSESVNFYNHVAAGFQYVSQKRQRYLDAVDEIVIAMSSGERYLDVGAGDGRRTKKIAFGRFSSTTAIDNSEAMCRACSSLGIDTHCISIDDFRSPVKYDTITCLWNVLGHVDCPYEAIGKMISMLSTTGKIFIDVNNKCNTREYGVLNSIRNAVSGRSSFSLDAHTSVRLFGPYELDNAFKGMQLRKIYIDYRTGARKCFMWQGQILYVAQKTTGR